MRRTLVHAGFHKTGTTSVQRFLSKNRAALRPEALVFLHEHMPAVCESARLDRIVDMVKLAVAPHRVESTSLEISSAMPLGPVTPILDLLEISQDRRAELTNVPIANPSLPPELCDDFVRINRSDMSEAERRTAKQALKGRWKWREEDTSR